ncbi:MAG: UMP kinase [Bacillota bacterium]|nr:UMP kinase [Bacillota bacterium]
MSEEAAYKRVLLKISGEALAGDKKSGLDADTINNICDKIKEIIGMGVQLGIVVGGGNFWRGRNGAEMDRTRADHMGMLATVLNSLALQDALENKGVPTRVMTAIEMKEIAEPYIRNKAVCHLEKGRVVIFGCGLGVPFVSTDTAAALRAAEINADILLLAKNINYIYSDDPKKNPNAEKLLEISYSEILAKRLGVMDATATSFSMDTNMPIMLFGLDDPENLVRAIKGEKIGTIVKEA